MTVMEWEKKFYDIIHETESNLAKARLKLQSKSLSKEADRFPDTTGSFNQSFSFRQPLSSACWTSSCVGALAGSLPVMKQGHDISDTYTSEMGELLSKIDTQNLMIDRLERLVRTLNQEKNLYRRHISDLQHDVGGISSQWNESRFMSPHLETQVDLMRHEVRSDMQRLQNMISAARNSSLHSNNLERSFHDMQHSVHTELDGIRRDLNSMTRRLGRLELDVSTHNVSQRDLQDGLKTSAVAPTGRLGHSKQSIGQPASSQVHDLRWTLTELQGKLDTLEGHLAARNTAHSLHSPSYRGLRNYSKLHKPSSSRLKLSNYNNDSDDDDDDSADLDLSDLDLSSDEDSSPDISDELSDDLEEIINVRQGSALRQRAGARGGGLMSSTGNTLAQLNLSSSDGMSEDADLSDLDLNNLDLSSGEGSGDLDSVEEGSIDLKLDDL